MFPVSSNLFGDVAIEAMSAAYQVLAKASLNIEKHQEYQENMVSRHFIPILPFQNFLIIQTILLNVNLNFEYLQK
jgi:hypothetical protein